MEEELVVVLVEVVVAWLLFLPLLFPETSGPFSIMAGMGLEGDKEKEGGDQSQNGGRSERE